MTKRNTSIRINGRHYDAVTGALLSSDNKAVSKPIDSVVGPVKPRVPAAAPIKSASRAQPSRPARKAAAHATVPHGTPSATLMRHAVKKPATKPLKRQAKVQSAVLAVHAEHHQITHAVVKPKLSSGSVDHRRHARAQNVQLSPHISHFAREAARITPAIHEAVAAIDKAVVLPTSVSTPTYRPDVVAVRAPRGGTSDIFEQALLRATSHEQPEPPQTAAAKRRRARAARSLRQRMVSYAAGAVAVLAIVGLFGNQHINNSPVHQAASKAGFSVVEPGYTPAGYRIASAQSMNGYFGLNYQSANGRTFAITEKPSSWDNETLFTNLTADKNTQLYTTLNKDGRTVYVYGRNQAAWVKDGILYQILGNGSLSIHEFGQIAASL